MTIFLSGGGSGEKSKNLDSAFIRSIEGSKPILYIPLARNPPYDSCLKWILDNFRSFKFVNFEMINDTNQLSKINLSNFSGVYIGGGNTYRLLKELRKSKFVNKLKTYIKKGGLIYGGSAGAIIMGKDISTTNSKNESRIRNYKGLGVVGNFSIFCHYKNEDDEKIRSYIKSTQNKVLALPEDAGMIIDKFKIKIIGHDVVLFDNLIKKAIHSNSLIKL